MMNQAYLISGTIWTINLAGFLICLQLQVNPYFLVVMSICVLGWSLIQMTVSLLWILSKIFLEPFSSLWESFGICIRRISCCKSLLDGNSNKLSKKKKKNNNKNNQQENNNNSPPPLILSETEGEDNDNKITSPLAFNLAQIQTPIHSNETLTTKTSESSEETQPNLSPSPINSGMEEKIENIEETSIPIIETELED